MIGQTISHYRIVSQLGVGGMGVVYAAHDPRLNREVALKFVPDELAHDAHTLERLRSEARTASGLNHPNICTIYDIGEHDGRPFIVMELLKGITLRDRLSTRPLKIHETIDIGIQVSDALYWAHSKDVIHRDIKPANLFLVDHGQVKILDFGLAKLVAPQAGSEATLAPTIDLTAVGIALGTVAYMSPEQVSGDTLDRRTDLFSLGVVLYECATGHQPFKGKTSAVVLASILTQSPTAPAALNAEVPPRLQEVITTCLEKDRELRYQDAAGLRADLRRIKRDIESGALKNPALLASGAINVSSVSGSTQTIAQSPDSGGMKSSQALAVPQNRRALMIGAGTVVVVAGLAAAMMMFRIGPSSPSEPAPAAAIAPAAPGDATTAAAPPPATTDPATQARARFDEAIVETNRLLAAGDTDGATRALNAARAIDPGAPVVADLSARLVERFRADAEARRASSDKSRTESSRRPSEPAPIVRPRVDATSQTRPDATSQRPDATSQPRPEATPQPRSDAGTPQPSAAPITPQTSPARPAPAEPSSPTSQPAPPRSDLPAERRAPAPATTPVEDDDAAIRRVVATYARAIEGKDLQLFRSVKPNMSAVEQRRIEEGFRAVTSQRVDVTILAIEQRGQEASVRLRRRDVIQAGGRQQTADSQQTMTLTKTGTSWVIREIGR
jgi:serine/threonine protein kinase